MSAAENPYLEGWTPAREARLRELKAKNYSAAQIAKDLGATTREAVVGKLDRLGLTKKGRKRCVAERYGDPAKSTNRGVKTKLLAVDLSPAERLRPRRFSWEEAGP